MSELKVASILDASGGNTAVINGFTPTESNMAGRNRIINGEMRIDQRNAGAAYTSTNSNTYVLDRWATFETGGVASRFTVQQNAGSVTPPTGFTNYLGVTSSVASSVSSGMIQSIVQKIEGFNASDLAWGTANAQTVTVSFWVRSSLTGTFGGVLSNGAINYSYPFSYTVSAVNTWEYKTVIIAGPTAGTWNTTNGAGPTLQFVIGTGTTYQGSAGSWSASGFYGVTGTTDLTTTNGATFYITGVQLEVGEVATPFQRRSYGQELALCQRYYEHSFGANVAAGTATTNGRKMIITGTATNNAIATSVEFGVEKRAAPTMSTWDANGNSGRITTFAANTAATENETPSVGFGEISTKAARIGNAGTSRAGLAFSWAASSEL